MRVPRTLTTGNDACHRRVDPTTTETARCVHTCDHYGVATEEPQRAVTSAPTTPTTCVAAPLEKARPWRTTAATTVVL
jgi:hypothetical protein